MVGTKKTGKAPARPRTRADGLCARIAHLRARRGGTVPVQEAVAIIDGVLAAGARVAARSRKLRAEIHRLSKFIDAARADIIGVRASEVKQEFIPTATDELDAVIGATADATNAIMDATEIVEQVVGSLEGEASKKLMEATTKIYEACGFQDITGQRITKVVKTLKQIEERVDALDAAFGDESRTAASKKAGPAAKTVNAPAKKDSARKEITDADLLNGPQLKKTAKSQDEIDALLFGSGR